MKRILVSCWVFLSAVSLYAKLPPGLPGHVYKTVGETPLKLYVIEAEGRREKDPAPAIVFFHGGGWMSGGPGAFSEQGQELAPMGITTILVQYRLSNTNKKPPLICIEDAKSAMRWVRSHAEELGIDPDRIAAAGASAGGHLAACTGMIEGGNDPSDDLSVSEKPQAVLLYNAVVDNGPGGYGSRRFGESYKELSPMYTIQEGAPPTLFLLGSTDKIIPVSVGERFKQKMDEVGSRCDLYIFEGMPHSFYNKPYGGEEGYNAAMNATVDFLASLGWIDRDGR